MERPVSSVLVEAADIVIPDTSHILGGGGFGTVYHGTLRGEAVAVKVIRLGREHEVAQRDFLNEVKVWDRIRQRNVLPLLAYCEEPLMLVSDLVDGGDLRQALVRENWDLSLGWKYLLDVAKGMSYLHSLDIIHSDLKPGNILVDEGIAKIVDFGLSKLRDPFRSSEDDTTWGGTPGYMGPEFADPTSIGKPADVFSFAMILYEVAAQGQRPFGSALSARQVSWAIRAGTRPVRPYASEGITDATWDLITKCWAQEPSMRPTFATAKEQLIERQIRDKPRSVPEVSKDALELSLYLLGTSHHHVVYRGRLHGATAVAVKMRNAPTASRETLEVFLNEVRMWGRLQHRNIQPLVAYCISPPAFVMNLAEDGISTDYLGKHHWDMALSLQLMLDVAEGMLFLHSLSIVHSNLKPRAILVDRGIAKVSSFGLAGLDDIAASAFTPECAAPEQFGRDYKLGKPVDVYSFAMVCYIVCNQGRNFFDGWDLERLRLFLKEGRRPSHLPGVNEDVWMLIMRCWAQDPQQRPVFKLVRDDVARILRTFKPSDNGDNYVEFLSLDSLETVQQRAETRRRLEQAATEAKHSSSNEQKEGFDVPPPEITLSVNAVKVRRADLVINGFAPLHRLAANGNEDAIRRLAQDKTIDMDVMDSNGYTPLLFAVRKAQAHVVRYLLLLGDRVDPNRARNDGMTALLRAVQGGSAHIVEILLKEQRVDPNLADKDGNTALHIAARGGSAKCLHMLLDRPEVDVLRENNSGKTVLDLLHNSQDESLTLAKARLDDAIRAQVEGRPRMMLPAMKLDLHRDLTLGKPIGKLGAGMNYEATLRARASSAMPLGGNVAIKVETFPWSDTDFEEQVITWAHAGKHNNFPSLIGYCESPKALVFQKVLGDSFGDYVWHIWRGKAGPTPTAGQYYRASALLLLDIARALAHLHERCVIHGNVRDDTVLVDATGPHPHAVLTEFAQFQIRIDASVSKGINLDESALKWAFTTPEMMVTFPRPQRKPAIDIYAFAMLIYITGSGGYPPFYAMEKDRADAARIRLNQDRTCRPQLPPDPSISNWNMPSMPTGLQQLMENCWAHDPAARPTMMEVVGVLERMVSSGGELAPPDRGEDASLSPTGVDVTASAVSLLPHDQASDPSVADLRDVSNNTSMLELELGQSGTTSSATLSEFSVPQVSEYISPPGT